MNKKHFILFLFLVMAFALKAQEQVHLFPDRSSCVSGDTLWFNVVIINQTPDNTGNVIHIQLDDLNNHHIMKVSVVCEGNNAEGYLHVPDSLSTGVYVLKAFTNLQKSNPATIIHQKLVTIYNRFESVINLIDLPKTNTSEFGEIPDISIVSNQESSIMNVKIDLPDNICKDALELIVTARLADPFADKFSSGWVNGTISQETEKYMAVSENTGIIISGRIYSLTDGSPKPGSTVLLSIPDTLPYFDYCIADEQGRFFFYIRNVIGAGNLVLQELTDNQEDTGMELFQNYIETPGINSEEQVLTNEQRSFSSDIVKASYFDKFFYHSQSLSSDTFSIRKDFTYPFYGPPTKSFYPKLFIDLDNFTEISREILRGVQYRVRKEQASIRMLDYGTESIFAGEPFKLFDGIPVFDPGFFNDMGTNKIKRVDAVFYKRFFGDLRFDGVLAIYSNNPTLSWIESIPGVSLIHCNYLQPALRWNFSNKTSRYANIPNFEKVFYRERMEHIQSDNNFSFETSDIKGDILIEVIAVCKGNEIYQSRKVIENRKQRVIDKTGN